MFLIVQADVLPFHKTIEPSDLDLLLLVFTCAVIWGSIEDTGISCLELWTSITSVVILLSPDLLIIAETTRWLLKDIFKGSICTLSDRANLLVWCINQWLSSRVFDSWLHSFQIQRRMDTILVSGCLFKVLGWDKYFLKCVEVCLFVKVSVWNGMLLDHWDGVVSSHDCLHGGLPAFIKFRLTWVDLHIWHSAEVILCWFAKTVALVLSFGGPGEATVLERFFDCVLLEQFGEVGVQWQHSCPLVCHPVQLLLDARLGLHA